MEGELKMIKVKDIMFSQPQNEKDISIIEDGKLFIMTAIQFIEMYEQYKKENSLKEFQ